MSALDVAFVEDVVNGGLGNAGMDGELHLGDLAAVDLFARPKCQRCHLSDLPYRPRQGGGTTHKNPRIPPQIYCSAFSVTGQLDHHGGGVYKSDSVEKPDAWHTQGDPIAGGRDMSMQTSFAAEVPKETRRLVEPLLAADSAYRLVGRKDTGCWSRSRDTGAMN
jgi:hypothetical protein